MCPSRFHPIEDGLWSDAKLEGCSFEEHGFFAFLCSNFRQRPSGIYRASNEQLSADTTLPIKRVIEYLTDLHSRGRIVRHGSWIFVKNYLKRQPHQERLLKGVQSDLENCDSEPILESFSEQYPLYSKWSTDRLLQMRTNVCTNPNTIQTQTQTQTQTQGARSRPGNGRDLDLFHTLVLLYPNVGPEDRALKAYKATKIPSDVLSIVQSQIDYKHECDRKGKFCPDFPFLAKWIKEQRWTMKLPHVPETPFERLVREAEEERHAS